ncbi:hypothetical protein IMW75_12995 [Pseudomonas gregormendelii]|uniref:Uncharacterized protein n=2 Tax=Pseudomonas TaxID=286 RepID=A0A4P6G3C0_9PSED|nr:MULTISPECIES: hypothetical protein [Pseudomonas]MBN3966189.1 hypothetical protein [Pseudomonas gregormendelii]QAY85899.1 hypothetical protein CUN61_18760 [Pseudomonas arsenicoxydans]
MRPRKEKAQKLIDKCGVLYWKWQELLEKTEDDVEAERQGNKRMGRPPIPLKTLRERAETAYQQELAELREFEIQLGIEETPEVEIIENGERLRQKGPGRPGISEIGRKFRHLRRKLKHLEDAMSAVDETASPVYDGLGRPAMSSRERIGYYQRDIEQIKKDIDAELSKMSSAERTKILLDNARIDRRDLNMKLKKEPENNEAIQALIEKLDSEISSLEQQLEEEGQASKPFVQAPLITQVVRSPREYSPAVSELIRKLESQLIVTNPPAELTLESLEKYKAEVALANEFNGAIVSQIEALKSV